MTRPALRLAVLALALTSSRAFGDAHCVDDIRKAGPSGSFCSGSSGPPPSAASPSPAAASQLSSMASGAVGGAVGSILGNALVTPLANQYKGHVPVKPVVGDDDDVFKTHPIGITAADDIIGNYTAQNDSYAGKLNHFRQLHDAEMDKRRDALELIKGTSAEKWCAAHINILFPTPPVSDVLNRYENTVRAYDREKQSWDKRCGGPSVMPGYESFTEGLAGLKPDAAPGSVAKTSAAPKPPADAEDEPAAPAKTADAKASAPPEDDSVNDLLPTPPPATAHGEVTDEQAPPSPAVPNAAPDAPAPDGAPSQETSADSSKNTNHSTNFFGIPNAKVTAADLQDQRAPDLTAPKLGSAPGTPPSSRGAKPQSPGGAKAPGGGEPPLASGTPKMLSTHSAPDTPMGWNLPNRWSSPGEVVSGGKCPLTCAEVLENQGAALDAYRAKAVEFPLAIIKGHLDYGLSLLKSEVKAYAIKEAKAVWKGTYGIAPDEPSPYFDTTGMKPCGGGAIIGVTDQACDRPTPSLGNDERGHRDMVLNPLPVTVANWSGILSSPEDPKSGTAPIVFGREHRLTFDDIAGLREAEAFSGIAYRPQSVPLLQSPAFLALVQSKSGLAGNLKTTWDMGQAMKKYAQDITACTQGSDDAGECLKVNDTAFKSMTGPLNGTAGAFPLALVSAAKDSLHGYVANVLNTSEKLIEQAADCLGGCP